MARDNSPSGPRPDPRSFYVEAPADPVAAGAPPVDEYRADQYRADQYRVDQPRVDQPRVDQPRVDDYGVEEVAPPAPRRRRRWRRYVVLALVLLLVAAAGELLYLRSVWRSVERASMEGSLAAEPADGINYLIVGSDSREGVDPDDPNAGSILGGGLGSQRTDTIVLLNVSANGSTMMAIPRDLFVTIADTGSSGRINAAIQGGPARLVRTIEANLGVPVHHFVAVDFVGFVGLVDALGGVTIDFPHPAFDRKSGLDVGQAGPQNLDGPQALAYVRSRTYTEIIDGAEVVDRRSDLGRVERQQDFLRAVLGDARSVRNPFTVNRVASGMSDHLVVDDQMGIRDVLRMMQRLARQSPETVVLPTRPFTTEGGAQVLGLEAEAAQPSLDRFR